MDHARSGFNRRNWSQLFSFFPVLDSILFDLLYTIIIISSKSLFNFINDDNKLSFIMSESIVANEKLKKKERDQQLIFYQGLLNVSTFLRQMEERYKLDV